MIGRSIGHYTVIEKLGEGGMGVVYKARDAHLDRLVALKVLPAERVGDPERVRRFVQEARAASALNHPNIVTVHDIDRADGVHFIAMEYVAGKPLDELIARKPPRLGAALDYAIQIADALAAAHAAGIVHRDLKPSNIVVDDSGRVKVLDFGLAKLTGKGESGFASTETAGPKTEEGAIVGTVAYMSPEQAEGKAVDARSDMFSFGLVLYEMLTQRNPFRRESRISTLAAIIGEDAKPLSEIAAAVPPEVERAVLRCLRKEPQRRWQSMSDLKTVLEDLKQDSESGKGGGAAKPAGARRRRWLIPVLTGGAVLAVLAGVLLWRWASPQPAGQPEVARLTFDSGYTGEPSLSRDGKILVYSSDRAGGLQDIWVRHIDRPQATRRTHDPAGAREPSISPDGSRIVFRSEREGGGIYVMDTLGGEEHKVVSYGMNPRFSPDGTQLVCVRRSGTLSALDNKMFLLSPDGGDPRPFQPEFGAALGTEGAGPIWSPDGRHLLFKGLRRGDRGVGWWVAPAAGGPAVSMGAAKVFPEAFGPRLNSAWPFPDTLIVTDGTTIEGINFFRIGVSAGDFQMTGKPRRLTSGPGIRGRTSVAGDGTMVFDIMTWLTNLWRVGVDANSGRTVGSVERVTADTTTKVMVSASADGSKVAYVAVAGMQPPRVEVRLLEVASGHETVLSESGGALGKLPKVSPDGTQVAFRDSTPEGMAAFIASRAGERRRVCGGCSVLGFFPGQQELAVLYGRNRLVRQELESGRQSVLLAPPAGAITSAAVAPGGRRLAFSIEKPGGISGIYVAAVKNTAVPEQEWITVSESDTGWHSSPGWSASGKLLYYLSEPDGPMAVWARRFDPATGKAVGESFVALRPPGLRPGFLGPRGLISLSVARDKLFLIMSESSSNIWMMKLEPR